MINPSANGWIDKFFTKNSSNFIDFESYKDYYEQLQKSGFIYGYTVSIPLKEPFSLENNSQDEITKIALLNALYSLFLLTTRQTDTQKFIFEAKEFYKSIEHENYNFLKKILPSENDVTKLEAILDDRVQTNSNLVSKNFSHIITNALLFIDILAFQQYLLQKNISSDYIREFEQRCINLILLTFNSKKNKTKYDELLLKLFENSVRLTKIPTSEQIDLESINFDEYHSLLEKMYLLDIVEMALWSDEPLKKSETDFLHRIAEKLKLTDENVVSGCKNIDWFIQNYKEEIPYFNYSNPVKHFYNHTQQTVSILVNRNKKRLVKEISESKELMSLLIQSASRKLSKEEKRKVKDQILDICKTIPSLTIFLLPGGSILLPILLKYVPQLLPSSFNENLNK